MTLQSGFPSMIPGSCDEGTRTSKRYRPPSQRREKTASQEWQKSRSELAFADLLADSRLTPFDKLIVTILADYCRADWNGLCWPTNRELAEKAGVHIGAKDGGEARVNRSLKKLQDLGFIERIGRYDFDRWMDEIGRPRLGLKVPKTKGDPHRFIVLWWKFPGSERDSGSAGKKRSDVPLNKCDPGAGAAVNKDHPRAVDCLTPAPSTATPPAPAPTLRTSSKSELPKGTVNVNAAAPQQTEPNAGTGHTTDGEVLPPAAPPVSPPIVPTGPAWTASEQAEKLVKKFRDRGLYPRVEPGPDLMDVIRFGANSPGVEPPSPDELAELKRLRPQVIAFLKRGAGKSRPTNGTADLIAALIRPGATDDDVKLAARKLAEELDDLHSVNNHRKILAEVRAGTMPLKAVLSAHKAAMGNAIERRGALFTTLVEDARDGAGRR